VVALADLRRELDRVADGPAAEGDASSPSARTDDSETPETIDEIVAAAITDLPTVPLPSVVSEVGDEPAGASDAGDADLAADTDAPAGAGTDEQRARRRRGRRGGRRGRRPGERGPTPTQE
jgi:hypothetical protein